MEADASYVSFCWEAGGGNQANDADGEMESWINEESNLVFVGDSCHPMLPYLAQGANSSLEDGAVLGGLLGHMQDKAQLPQILRLYEGLRKSRGEAIVRETFKQVRGDPAVRIENLQILTA